MTVGAINGVKVGVAEGTTVGFSVGPGNGCRVGKGVGRYVGEAVGDEVVQTSTTGSVTFAPSTIVPRRVQEQVTESVV